MWSVAGLGTTTHGGFARPTGAGTHRRANTTPWAFALPSSGRVKSKRSLAGLVKPESGREREWRWNKSGALWRPPHSEQSEQGAPATRGWLDWFFSSVAIAICGAGNPHSELHKHD